MKRSKPRPPASPKSPTSPSSPPVVVGPTFRSGAVARMAGMPVATLRIWEQRYRAVQPGTAPSGHRLYSPADVQRVLMLRQLTGQGHAIGSIAALDSTRLRDVIEQASLAPARNAPCVDRGSVGARAALRVAVVGPALAARLQRPAVVRPLAHAPPRVTVFESFADVARAGRRGDAAADLLLWHAPELRPELPREWRAAQRACRAERVAVVYRFAGSAATRAVADAGMSSLREPADDESLGAWLASLEAGLPVRALDAQAAPGAAASEGSRSPSPPGTPAPRRYDDATLTAFAGLSSTLACECPRHVAELLMQLSSFEAYSAGCADRDEADAQLHAYLRQVAGASRALFEAALERVARHEGWSLR